VKVLVLEQLSEAHLARVRAAAGPASVVPVSAGDGRPAALAEAEVVFGAVGRDAFPAARRLRWIHVPLTFVDGYLFPALVASEVALTSTKDCVGTHLAEQAFGLLLALTRSIAAAVREPRWDVRPTLRANARELAGQTMGVVGLSESARGAGRHDAKRDPGVRGSGAGAPRPRDEAGEGAHPDGVLRQTLHPPQGGDPAPAGPGRRLPAYVTREQARAVIAAAQSTRDRLLFECLWQTGGRVTEVLRLRRGDVDARERTLRLPNLK
jgi:hypothetical protein